MREKVNEDLATAAGAMVACRRDVVRTDNFSSFGSRSVINQFGSAGVMQIQTTIRPQDTHFFHDLCSTASILFLPFHCITLGYHLAPLLSFYGTRFIKLHDANTSGSASETLSISSFNATLAGLHVSLCVADKQGDTSAFDLP